jgi:hypothetical protein
MDDSIKHSLPRLYKSSVSLRVIFDWAANRQNDATTTSIDTIMTLTGLGRQEALDLMRQLVDAGVGDIIVGRKGWKTRIQWRFSLKSIGKGARGEGDLADVDPILRTEQLDTEPSQSEGPTLSPTSTVATAPLQLSIEEAKAALAAKYGVSVSNIEIVIRA